MGIPRAYVAFDSCWLYVKPSIVRRLLPIVCKMDDPALASLSLTHVRYNPNDPFSYASAWLALVPQGLCVTYVTLIWASREVEILLMFAGQMACEALNFGLKRLIREERPQRKDNRTCGCYFDMYPHQPRATRLRHFRKEYCCHCWHAWELELWLQAGFISTIILQSRYWLVWLLELSLLSSGFSSRLC